ncbi:MAG: glycoside hydrolase family 130 protein [Chloroflexota bacterium]|nr:glycoside hydrolase family 130 protein [Chloroflexota bacterium]
MHDLAARFDSHPLLGPRDVAPSRPGLRVICVLNPGAFTFQHKTWLALRVAEGIPSTDSMVSAIVLDPSAVDGINRLEVRTDDPALQSGDPRGFRYQGRAYLTTLSHLRLASSTDGVRFEVTPRPSFEGLGPLESFGVEDCRVTLLDGRFYLTYTAVSSNGFGVGLASTVDWHTYERHGMVLAPPNKDCVLFPEQVGGRYVMLHRPVADDLGGKYMWTAWSPDLVHWGEHQCILRTRSGMWDSAKIGAGPPPFRIPEGWLEIYHGADENDRYCLGAVLLAADDPTRVLGRSGAPIMQPLADYERGGFYGNVVFATGATVRDDQLTLYYGAADTIVCGATFSIRSIVGGLE